MPSGTGLDAFAKKFPKRSFDVGIAEQHAVTFAAGMATEGMKPFCAIYSTFLQRAYDQVVHDVALQSLPVRFAMDRAGLVGADGATHAGSFDIAYLGCLPGMVLMAASDEVELMHMVATAAAIDDRPSAFRYPRGEGYGLELPKRGTPLADRPRARAEARARASPSSPTARGCARRSRRRTSSARAGFPPPSPMRASPSRSTRRWCERLAREHAVLITVEEGAVGGFGSHGDAAPRLARACSTSGLKVRPMCLPDRFIDHDAPKKQYDEAGLNAAHIVAAAVSALGADAKALPARA